MFGLPFFFFWPRPQHMAMAGVFTIHVSYGNIYHTFFFFYHICSMWKFPGEGLNLCHSSDPSHCSVHARSLTHCTTGELAVPQKPFLDFLLCSTDLSIWTQQHASSLNIALHFVLPTVEKIHLHSVSELKVS